MRNFKYLFVCFVLLMFFGCKDILDTHPQQSVSEDRALNNSDNIKNVLNGAYDQLGAEGTFGGFMLFDADLMGIGDEVKYDGTQPPPGDVHRKEVTISDSYVNEMWSNGYETINTANNVLSVLDKVNKEDQERVEGEAKFIRAIVYFQLVRLFGKDYGDGDPAQNLGVPLVLKPTKTIDKSSNVARNTVQEVYDQVIKDLKDAESKLKEHPPSYVYAGKYAASALLARVYLQQGKYKLARDEANKVIKDGPYSLVENFSDEFNNSSTNTSEDIFSIQVSNQHGFNVLQNAYSSLSKGGSNQWRTIITQDHLQLYEPNDDRRNLFYKDDNRGDWHTGKWKNEYGNVIVMRLAEMYLIRAEGNERRNESKGATPTDDINKLRERVGLNDLTSPVTLQQILDERHLELAFEGHFLFDLKRTKGSVEGIPWDSPRLVFPIPQREIDANSNLEQNEGYSGG